MPAVILPEKVFHNEPYRSILHLLIDRKDDGLTLKEIQYSLIEEHFLNTTYRQKYLDDIIQNLIKQNKFKRYSIKSISRKKTKSNKARKLSTRTEKAENIRNNILGFLNRLKNINAIYKKDKKYFINDVFFNTGLKIQNKEVLDSYNCNNITSFPIDNSLSKNILYGLSKDLFNKFNDDEKSLIKKSIGQIEEKLRLIEELKFKKLNNIWIERIENFCNEVKNKKIKKAFKENMHQFLFMYTVLFVPVGNSFKRKKPPTEEEYFSYAYGAPIREFEGYLQKLKQTNNKNYKLFLKEFTKIWSETWFKKDYFFSPQDIEQIIHWAYQYLEEEYNLFPNGIAYSRYSEYKRNELVSYF